MKNKSVSAYSKMYLVTPSVYEKLLRCLDDGDKRVTEDINKEPETEELRPSEIELQNVGTADILEPQTQPILQERLYGNPVQENIPGPAIQDPVVLVEGNPTEQQIQSPVPGIPQIMPPVSQARKVRVVLPDEDVSMIQDIRPSTSAKDIVFNPTKIYGPTDENLPLSAYKPRCVNTKQGQLCSVDVRSRPKLSVKMKSQAQRMIGHFCPICGREFSRANNLKRHVETVHEGKKGSITKQSAVKSMPIIVEENEPLQAEPQVIQAPQASRLIVPEVSNPDVPDFETWKKQAELRPRRMEGVTESGRKRTVKRTKFKDIYPGKGRRIAPKEDEDEGEEEFQEWQ